MATGSVTISNKGTGPLFVTVTQVKHNPPLTETGGGGPFVVPVGGPSHGVTIVYSPTKKGKTSDAFSITSDDSTQHKPIKVTIKATAK
jgi:hypothetical protein